MQKEPARPFALYVISWRQQAQRPFLLWYGLSLIAVSYTHLDVYKRQALGDVYRIAADNGTRVKARGEVNRLSASANGDCGTLGWFKSPINEKNYFCEDITEIYDLGTTISNIQWAIGGCNL